MEYAPKELFQRFVLARGQAALDAMQRQTFIQVGVGAVGGFCAETLARCGAGKIVLVDFDRIEPSNVNRQLVATTETIGQFKVDVMARRVRAINPGCKTVAVAERLNGDSFMQLYAREGPAIVCDAIDQFVQKCEIIRMCLENGIMLVSSMGAARKTDPTCITLVPLNQITICPLAKRVKKQLGVQRDDCYDNILCVLSTEKPLQHPKDEDGTKLSLPSYSVITSMFGLYEAHAAIDACVTGTMVINKRAHNRK